jgi:hypothetical protein
LYLFEQTSIDLINACDLYHIVQLYDINAEPQSL